MSQDGDEGLLAVPPSTQDHRQGSLNAVVVLVLYGDYQSPQSADVYRLVKVMQRQLSASSGEDYLCLVFRHFPQRQLHAQAQRAAEAAEAAADQGRFWQMHDMLFNHQQELGNGYLVEYANRLELDISRFLQAMSGHRHIDRINQDIESGLNSGVAKAPALFINGNRYVDRWSMDGLMAAIATAGH
ncbi:MAG: DsbA family protein [Leptolyngbya sp. BL-A-14]